ncbi:copper transporter [Janibacter terrae]|uniref:Copper transporter n=1 Tax=Janibacter terrae TaxID=103817 RepID=A0ABZ2FBU7_9MICO
MIDFRYHLVSLAAVLIALSIGIVLGAGPLNDNIGSTLSGEVTKLRQEKEALRKDGNEQRAAIEARDTYDEQTLPLVVQGRLSDRTVAVVRLAEGADDDVQALRETLEDAGATVEEPVEVSATWASTADEIVSSRSATGEAALRDLGVSAAVPDGGQRIDQALAVVLTGTRSPQDGGDRVSREQRQQAWTRLKDAGLVDGPDETPDAADLVVVVGGPVPAEDSSDTDTVDRQAEGTSGVWVALTHLIETHAQGTVLAADEAADGTSDSSPVTMARLQGSLAEGVSTVDDPAVPMGRAAIVLALVEQLTGDSGHYGTGAGAARPVPTFQ